jgi:hypothetical protein
MAIFSFALSSLSSSRIWAWIVTSSAVVGSSAISSFGLHGQRHGDHDALPHAARELVRIFLHPPLGVRDVDELQHLDRLVHGVAPAEALVQPAGLGDLLAAGEDGFSEVMGSWKIIEISLPRILRISIRRQRERGCAVVEISPSTILPGGCGISFMMLRRRHRLCPQPDSPTTPSVSPLLDVEVHAVHGANDAFVGEEVRLEVLDVQEAFGHEGGSPRRLRDGSGHPGRRDFLERFESSRDVVRVHVLVRHAADRGRSDLVDLDLAREAAGHEFAGAPWAVDVEDHDVRLYVVELQLDSWELGDPFPETTGIRVILGEALHHGT